MTLEDSRSAIRLGASNPDRVKEAATKNVRLVSWANVSEILSNSNWLLQLEYIIFSVDQEVADEPTVVQWLGRVAVEAAKGMILCNRWVPSVMHEWW